MPQAMTADATNRPELLSPAGDWEALHAAVANGADAVYFGLDDFNARRRAVNFDLTELPKVMDYLRDHNVRGYVALNTLIFPEELAVASKYAAGIADAGADAVIVQDLGLARLIHRQSPTLPIHASTQMTLNGARPFARLRELGVRRVILARELSIRQIADLASADAMELEVFVHGAMCLSYSGQCSASCSLLERSANRGLCAQPCRLPYRLLADGAAAPTDGPYVLSSKDLAAWDRLGPLLGAGVKGFKIEGRLKSACYVAAATALYRAALDAALAGKAFQPAARQLDDLAQSFSRGFSRGYLDGADPRELVESRFPKSRGVRIGQVVSVRAAGVIVRLEPAAGSAGGSAGRDRAGGAAPAIKPGDGVVLDQGRPERDEQGGRVFSVRVVAGAAPQGGAPRGRGAAARAGKAARVELTFGAGDVNLSAVAAGSTVWRTDDPRVRRRLRQSFTRDRVVRPQELALRVLAEPHRPLRVLLREPSGNCVELTSDEPLAASRTRPLTAAVLRRQFGRLGGTPFVLGEVELIGPAGPTETVPVMAPVSMLNELRRRAVGMLQAQRRARSRHTVADVGSLARLKEEIAVALPRAAAAGADEDRPGLHVLVRSVQGLEAALRLLPGVAPSGMVYADLPSADQFASAAALARSAGVGVALATPRVAEAGRDDVLHGILDARPDAVLVRNLSDLCFLERHAPDLARIGDASLNAANELTADLLRQWGLRRVTPAYDLPPAQWPALARRLGPRLEAVLHRHAPMFYTEHCLFAACLTGAGGGGGCRDCPRTCRTRELRLIDRNGVEHPVRTDPAGRNVIFHGRGESAWAVAPGLLGLGVRHFRVELVDESCGQLAALLGRWRTAVDARRR